jgi:murein DD-endopeptidase MepM/ murein hydrolase activator NlpD
MPREILAAMLGGVALLAADSFVPIEKRTLGMPVQGMRASDLRDTFDEKRSSARHEATDIVALRNTPVLAVEDGTIKSLFVSKAGGLTIYEFDPSERYCYYYAHLERYVPGLKVGQRVKKGQIIGYVGTSGNAPPDAPHLHFGVTIVGPEKKWWGGKPINPYPILVESYRRTTR